MLKINVSASKKVAGAAQYSSDHYHCGLEIEVADTLLGSADLERQIDHLYRVCNSVVDTQLAKREIGGKTPARQQLPPAVELATEKQIKYLRNLAYDKLGMNAEGLNAFTDKILGPNVLQLTRTQASLLIQELQKQMEPKAGKP